MRSSTAAVFAMFYALAGTGIGPTFVGYASDRIASSALGQEGYLQVCRAGATAPEMMGACADAARAGLVGALSLCVLSYAAAALFYWLASRTLRTDLKVPVGTAATIQHRLSGLDASEYRTFRFHTVKKGETVATIARRYNLTTKQLRDANDLSSTSKVARNQTLMIPQRAASALPTASAARPPASTRTMASSSSASGPQTYRVRQGDTLYSIARQFGTTIGDLRRLNQLSNDRIKIGDRLITYGPETTAIFHRAASYVDRILRGANPGDLPAQAPTKFELAVNLRTAKTLGLEIPSSLLARADEVIE